MADRLGALERAALAWGTAKEIPNEPVKTVPYDIENETLAPDEVRCVTCQYVLRVYPEAFQPLVCPTCGEPVRGQR